jgi:hypothetical protein
MYGILQFKGILFYASASYSDSLFLMSGEQYFTTVIINLGAVQYVYIAM